MTSGGRAVFSFLSIEYNRWLCGIISQITSLIDLVVTQHYYKK